MTESPITIEEYKSVLQYDPGNPLFVGYADLLRSEGKADEAMQTCLLGLTHNPSYHRGRLLLARLFYDKGYIPFAVKEIEILLKALPENGALLKLLDKLSPGAGVSLSSHADKPVEEKTLAEAEFDLGDLDLVEQDKKK